MFIRGRKEVKRQGEMWLSSVWGMRNPCQWKVLGLEVACLDGLRMGSVNGGQFTDDDGISEVGC